MRRVVPHWYCATTVSGDAAAKGCAMWLYDLPMSVGLPLFIVLVVGGSCLILLILRKWVFRVAPQGEEWDRVLSYACLLYTSPSPRD